MTFPFLFTLRGLYFGETVVDELTLTISFDEVFLYYLRAARRVALENAPWMSAIVLDLWDIEESVGVQLLTIDSVEIGKERRRFVVTAETVTFDCTLVSEGIEPVSIHLDFDKLVASCKAPVFIDCFSL